MMKWVFGMLGLSICGMGFWLKKAGAVSIIGGADGPTSVFVAGKISDPTAYGVIAIGVVLLLAAGICWMRERKK